MTVPSPEYLDPRLTEQRNPRTQRIDVAATLEIVDLINAEDATVAQAVRAVREDRSEEHTSELQSPCNLVCRLLLEKKKKETLFFVFAQRQRNATSHAPG